MITSAEFSNCIFREFPYSPTQGQQDLIKRLADFVVSEHGQFPLFLLEGYAGTGKTTVVSTLVKALPKAGYNAVLLAPTGRAAKVLSLYAQMPAYTIHKRLYRPAMDGDGQVHFQVLPNKSVRTLFIVDEASMIPDGRQSGESGAFQSRNLLEDLIGHVYSGEHCKMLFLGDSCQLPPVGISQSPALDKEIARIGDSFGGNPYPGKNNSACKRTSLASFRKGKRICRCDQHNWYGYARCHATSVQRLWPRKHRCNYPLEQTCKPF